MNLSTNKKKVVRTRDGYPLEEGLIVYVPCIEFGDMGFYTYEIKHWHNGINSNRYLPGSGRSLIVNLRG